jgi:hypothetical protein
VISGALVLEMLGNTDWGTAGARQSGNQRAISAPKTSCGYQKCLASGPRRSPSRNANVINLQTLRQHCAQKIYAAPQPKFPVTIFAGTLTSGGR